MTLRRFGMTSVLPASRGTQKLCATSADSSVRYVADARGHVQLVRGHDPEVRILELPPPLVADHAHVDGVGRRRGSLDLVDRPRGRRDQDEHDEDRHDGPRQLHRIAAVHLRRLAAVVAGTTPVAHAAVGEQSADEQKDGGGERQHEQRDRADGVCRMRRPARRCSRVPPRMCRLARRLVLTSRPPRQPLSPTPRCAARGLGVTWAGGSRSSRVLRRAAAHERDADERPRASHAPRG